MNYKCVLSDIYDIIKLRNIKNFNYKISSFIDNSCTQIALSNILKLPGNLPNIQSITKIYVSTQITSTKVISTIISETPNIEGMSLTGKTLLVHGELYGKIIYYSHVCSENHCLNFNTSFNTHIVINKNTDPNYDKLNVYTNIENVFAKLLDKRRLINDIHLFLFVHKINPSKKIPNFIIFTDINGLEIVRIEFDLYYENLNIKISDNISDSDFTFKLLDSNSRIKLESQILNTQNAQNFFNNLNNKPFEFGDIIELIYSNKSNVKLTNYPAQNIDYTMLGKNAQSFKITNPRIIPYKLPNTIFLNSKNNSLVVSFEFDILTKKFLIKSTSEICNPYYINQPYFEITLLESDGKTQKNTSLLNGNLSGITILNTFENQSFEYGDIIELFFEEPEKVSITNFPTEGEVYNPTETIEYYAITQNGLIRDTNISSINNLITFKGSNNDLIATVSFNNDDKKLIVTSTGIVAHYGFGSNEYFSLNLTKRDGTKIAASVKGNENANNFMNTLNKASFEFNDLITLNCKENSRVIISNYPNKYFNSYNPLSSSESFIITNIGLKSVFNVLKNQISLIAQYNFPAFTIKFDINTNKLVIFYTIFKTLSSFTFIVKDVQGIEKYSHTIQSNTPSKDFADALDGKPFNYGDIITLNYSDPSKVLISNYPTYRVNYTPKGLSESFIITPDILIPKP